MNDQPKEMTALEAVDYYYAKYKDSDWLLAVGVGTQEGRSTIHFYAKTDPPPIEKETIQDIEIRVLSELNWPPWNQ